ncbi:aubergine [Carabus blaptoides fortunei]
MRRYQRLQKRIQSFRGRITRVIWIIRRELQLSAPGLAPQPQGAWGPRPGGGPRPQQQAPPPQGAWGPKPGGPAAPAPQQYQQRAPAPVAHPGQAGRAVIRQPEPPGVAGEFEKLVVGPGGDNGNGNSAGRGSVRGRRQISYDTLLTRPSNLSSKRGTSGTPIRLQANYFELLTKTDWCLYQYRVDFAPDEDRTRVRKQLLGQACRDKLPGYLFDGSMLFTSNRIQPDPLELYVEPPGGAGTGENIRITIRLVGDVAQGDFHLIQFFNIIVRKCLSYMKLQLVGRNYYDAAARVCVYTATSHVQLTNIYVDGTKVSYIDYYRQRYQINIRQNGQPMLVSRAKARELRAGMAEIIYLVPELCRMTGLNDSERSNMQMMRALAEHTRLPPEGRQERLAQYSERMNRTPEIVNELKKWDMKLSPKLVEFPGRILPPENIIQGLRGDVKYSAGQDTDWTRNLRSSPMVLLGTVLSWVVVCPSALKRDAFSFVQALQKAAGGMSLKLPHPQLQEIADDRPSTYLQGLDGAIAQNPNLILCVASNQKADRYSAIKKKCCVDRAVPTQVILRKNIASKGVMSIATKVAIQINCKLGGAPWTMEMPLSNLMVVGFDVCHDTMNKGKSYGAMVASLDRQVTRYFSAVSAHTNGEELSNDFSLNIIKAIKRYQEVNGGQIPERIIVYRDGVGDGQLAQSLHRDPNPQLDNTLYFL